MLTHLVALTTPALGAGGAARAVSATTAAALIGRLATGFVVDRVNRRVVACVTLMIQLAGVALLAHVPSAAGVYAGCALFGLGVGNLTTLPGLILAVEWPREHFSGLVGLVVGINQLTFAFGPTLRGRRAGLGGRVRGGPRCVCRASGDQRGVDPARAGAGRADHSRADAYQSAREARPAPSTSARSLCQTMFVSTWTRPAKVPNPQSTPAMTFSRPTTLA